jgi:hypothetical protein
LTWGRARRTNYGKHGKFAFSARGRENSGGARQAKRAHASALMHIDAHWLRQTRSLRGVARRKSAHCKDLARRARIAREKSLRNGIDVARTRVAALTNALRLHCDGVSAALQWRCGGPRNPCGAAPLFRR